MTYEGEDGGGDQNEGPEVKKDLFNCTTFSDDSLFSSGLIRLVPLQGVTSPDNVR